MSSHRMEKDLENLRRPSLSKRSVSLVTKRYPLPWNHEGIDLTKVAVFYSNLRKVKILCLTIRSI